MLCPFALWKPVASHGGAISSDLGLVLHVTTNQDDPFGFFANPKNQASSHFWIANDGILEQYIDTDMASWAQAGGNYQYASVETSGTADQPMTEAEVITLSKLYAWGHAERGWPLQLADTPGAKGLGWHGMGGAAWGGHTGCPGDARKAQRSQVLTLAGGAPAGVQVPPCPGTVRRGSTGPAVVAYQAKLANRGWRIVADGVFGPSTELTVRQFQAEKRLTVDGIAGPQTWTALWTTPTT